MNMLITILSFILTLGILISVHEWGHFIVARKLGVKVLRFSLGFGKPIWRHQGKSGTEYCVSILPLGGYVKMLDEREGEVAASELAFAFNRQSVWKRIAIVLAGPFANFLFAILAFSCVYHIGIFDSSKVPAIIGGIEADTPAAHAHLQVGDHILAVNQAPVHNWPELVKVISAHPDEKVTLTLERQKQNMELEITPGKKLHHGQEIGFIGVALDKELLKPQSVPLYEAFINGVHDTWFYSLLTFKSIFEMLLGKLGLEHLSGPISIAVYAGDTAQMGLVYFLKFLALLSISLGVINLLPIPMLDGGHLLYYVLEAIMRKPLTLKMQQIGLSIGLVLLFSLMVLAFYNDVIQLGSR